MAKPVTSPESARATEPRKPEAVLELRRGAAPGRHRPGTRETAGRDERPQAGARCPCPGWLEDPSRASRCVFAVRCVAIFPA